MKSNEMGQWLDMVVDLALFVVDLMIEFNDMYGGDSTTMISTVK